MLAWAKPNFLGFFSFLFLFHFFSISLLFVFFLSLYIYIYNLPNSSILYPSTYRSLLKVKSLPDQLSYLILIQNISKIRSLLPVLFSLYPSLLLYFTNSFAAREKTEKVNNF